MGYLPYQLVQDFFHQPYEAVCFFFDSQGNSSENLKKTCQVNMQLSIVRSACLEILEIWGICFLYASKAWLMCQL